MTTELVVTSPLAAGSSASLALVPGRTSRFPFAVAAGETISIQTSSKDFWDTILVVLAPNGTPVVGNDDFKGYMAGLDWVAPTSRDLSGARHIVRGGGHRHAGRYSRLSAGAVSQRTALRPGRRRGARGSRPASTTFMS